MRKISKQFLFIFISVFILINCTSKNEQWKNKAVVQVDDYSLSTHEFSRRLARKLNMFDALSAKDSVIMNKAKSEVVEEFILEMINLDWAQKNNVFVRKELLDDEIKGVKKSYPDELSFKRALANEGIGYQEWQKKIRFSLLQRLVFQKITESAPKPTEDELKEHFKTNKSDYKQEAKVSLRQIVLETENNAQRMEEELKRGKKLSDLAKKYSITPDAVNGGLIGWIERGTLAIFDKAFSMYVGQRSDILKSEYGYHIFEVVDKRTSKMDKFEDVKSKVLSAVQEEKMQQTYSTWLEQQLRAAKIFKDIQMIAAIEVRTND